MDERIIANYRESVMIQAASAIITTGDGVLDNILSNFLSDMADKMRSSNGIPAMRGLGYEMAMEIATNTLTKEVIAS